MYSASELEKLEVHWHCTVSLAPHWEHRHCTHRVELHDWSLTVNSSRQPRTKPPIIATKRETGFKVKYG